MSVSVLREFFTNDSDYTNAVRQYARGIATIGAIEAAGRQGEELALLPEQIQALSQFQASSLNLASRSVAALLFADPETAVQFLAIEKEVIAEGIRQLNVDEAGVERALDAFIITARKIILQEFLASFSGIGAPENLNDIDGSLETLVVRGLFPSLNAAKEALVKEMASITVDN